MLLSLVVLVGLLGLVAGDQVAKPRSLVPGPSVGLVLLPDTDLQPSWYLSFSQSLVDQLSQYGVNAWVDVSSAPVGTPDATASAVSSAYQLLTSSYGLPAGSPLVLVGHGPLGGFASQDYLAAVKGDVRGSWAGGCSGQILLGSYLKRLYNYKLAVPTLTIGPELDGVVRVTRVMETYYHVGSNSRTNMASVIMGLNHVGFVNITDAQTPDFYLKTDLKPEIGKADGINQAAQLCGAYVANLLGSNSLVVQNILQNAQLQSATFFQPLIDAFTQEGFYFFLPPCDGPYSQKGNTNCQAASPTTPHAQISVCGLPDTHFIINDAFHDVSQFYPVDWIPSIQNSCPHPSGCVLNITTVSENMYLPDDWRNPISAIETAAKMKSRQACQQAAGAGKVNFQEADGPPLCGQFNANLYQSSLQLSAPGTLARFQTYGEPMVMGNDTVVTAFPSWAATPMSYKYSDSGLLVTAVALTSSVANPASPGYHFCSVLSPARVLEWVYVDGLRVKYTLGVK